MNESDRRRQIVQHKMTDWERWRDPCQLLAKWQKRANAAAKMIPASATVLDLGCGAMSLERELPQQCTYIPCDLIARDQRTIVCDFNGDNLPVLSNVTHVAILGVLEYILDCDRFIRDVAKFNCPIVASYHPVDCTSNWDRGSQGWVNAFSRRELTELFGAAQYAILKRVLLDSHQELMYVINKKKEDQPELIS